MKHKFVANATAVGLLLVAVTGCSSADRQTASGPVAAKAIATSSPSAMTLNDARTIYLQLSVAPNATREAWMSATAPTAGNLAGHKRLAAQAADATVAFSQGLREHRWPTNAQPYVTALDKHLQTRAAAYRRVAKAGTVPAYLAAAREVPVTTSLTGDVRKALGLPRGTVVTGATPR